MTVTAHYRGHQVFYSYALDAWCYDDGVPIATTERPCVECAVTADIAELSGIADTLKAELRTRLPAGTYSMNGADVIAIRPNRRLDIDAAVALVPEPLHEQCRPDGYDAKKVRAFLAPALVESVMVEVGAPRVTLL